MTIKGKGVMGKSFISIGETGRIDIWTRSGGNIFGPNDRGQTRHSHLILDKSDKTHYLRLEGSKKPIIDTKRRVP